MLLSIDCVFLQLSHHLAQLATEDPNADSALTPLEREGACISSTPNNIGSAQEVRTQNGKEATRRHWHWHWHRHRHQPPALLRSLIHK